MKRIKVKPAPGINVLDEQGRPFPEEGKEVNHTVFIIRRMKEGDLIVAETKKPRSKKSKEGDQE